MHRISAVKQQLRLVCQKQRQLISFQQQQRLGSIISQRLIHLLGPHLPTNVASYVPLAGEVDITPLNTYILKQNGHLLLPRVTGVDMSMHQVTGLNQLVRHGKMWQPSSDTCRCDEVPLIIVPGVAFDKLRNRMGYGKGYYDRFLANNNHHRSFLVGVVQEDLLFASIPAEPHDRKVDMIVTETSIIGGKPWKS
ncbi:5-formyltetrahydrofolate cyclo-ligase [Desulfurispira natronophila]|uniref:5-formyltetrahydrofolate cyclo-ligase n=1 Tax=Desulfurispira natronophila TaxID=682562 RepID=A0A7W7Y4V6_9BACT|nr:5-formyltetrahydrofolate cyclo-ligase [Desulfurispira natronophila]MBB5022042.1 5-formyltetrahydrofolate cyclo-ligase [Desulfurispira natronophila]